MRIYRSDDLIEKGKTIHIFKGKSAREMETHTHDFIELVYVISGQAAEVINNEEYLVKHGDMIFINYGGVHSFRPEEHFEYYNICFSPEVMADAIVTYENAFSLLSLTAFNEMRSETEDGKITFCGQARKEIETIFEMMLKEYQEKQKSWSSVLESYLNVVITKMLRVSQISIDTEQSGSVWQELLEYIDANLGSELNLSVLAEKCFYNPSYFSRVFKEKFGVSPIAYINQKRAESAAELLLKTNNTVEEICFKVGFSDRSCFYRIFTKYIGATPADYRKRYSK